MLITDETGTQRLVGYVHDLRNGAEGPAICWLDVQDQHLNRSGVLHGGLITMLLDNASGAACSLRIDPVRFIPVLTVSLTVQFLAPGRKGRVTAEGRVLRGRSTFFTEARLTQDDGTLLATATGIFKKPRPKET